MTVLKEIPRFIAVRGVRCKVWYRGQPLRCTICRKVGHTPSGCPMKGKCLKCSSSTHFARDCPNPWGTSTASVAETPSTGNNSNPDAAAASEPAEAMDANTPGNGDDLDVNDDDLDVNDEDDESDVNDEESDVTDDDDQNDVSLPTETPVSVPTPASTPAPVSAPPPVSAPTPVPQPSPTPVPPAVPATVPPPVSSPSAASALVDTEIRGGNVNITDRNVSELSRRNFKNVGAAYNHTLKEIRIVVDGKIYPIGPKDRYVFNDLQVSAKAAKSYYRSSHQV